MIQFNLLPDVKLEYIKAQRTKKLVFSISFVAGAIAIFIFVVLFAYTNVIQKKTISDIDKQIDANTKTLKDTKDIDKILTVQNQLNNLDELHGKKPIASRLFEYLKQLTPQEAKIGKISLNFAESTMSISGTAGSLQHVNKFADTLKFTSYTIDNGEESQKAFKSVVLESFGIEGNLATYTLTVSYEADLFDASKKIALVVPKQYITTRSITERPNIFDGNVGSPSTTTPQGGL